MSPKVSSPANLEKCARDEALLQGQGKVAVPARLFDLNQQGLDFSKLRSIQHLEAQLLRLDKGHLGHTAGVGQSRTPSFVLWA